jgi:hypothetical protein
MRLTALPALFLALALAPGGLAAQDGPQPMPPEAFESYATGKTLYYGTEQGVYGAEQYLPGRRVIWAFLDEPCKRGIWHPAGDQVCFVYDTDPETHCWTFYRSGSGLRAHFQGDPDGAPLIEVGQSPDPLFCPGPDVGV